MRLAWNAHGWCISHKGALQTRQLLNSLTFINGCQTYKSESISWHEKSKAHIFAEKCKNATENPADTPANKAKCALITKNATQQRRLFRTAFAVAKHRKSFKDYVWICDLQEANGVEMGKTYRNAKQCANFIGSIAESYRSQMSDTVTNSTKPQFISLSADGATDSAIMEQEIVFMRVSSEGTVSTKLVGITNPVSPSAVDVYSAIMDATESVGIPEAVLNKKLVGFACDGASVMLGHIGGVAAQLKKFQPSVTVVHCLAHRLELSFKVFVLSMINRLHLPIIAS